MTKAEMGKTVKASLPREPKTKARANRTIAWATFEEIKQGFASKGAEDKGQKKLATTVKPSGGA